MQPLHLSVASGDWQVTQLGIVSRKIESVPSFDRHVLCFSFNWRFRGQEVEVSGEL